MNYESSIILLFLSYASCQFDMNNFVKTLPQQIVDNLSTDPDKNMDTKTFIESRGFNWELYHATTGDGYVIDVYRIVHPFKAATRRPVLFATTSGGNAVEWLRNSAGGNVNESTDFVGPNIGFEAAKRGYDVWLMNWRGGDYLTDGFRQERFNIYFDRRYYEYSVDEYALFDLPAAIDLVRSVTGKQKIAYVGLVDATTPYFMLAATVPRFNSQIQPMIALPPEWTGVGKPPSLEKIHSKQKELRFLIELGGPSYPAPLLALLTRLSCNLKITQKFVCNPAFLAYLQSIFFGHTGSVNYDKLTVYATTAGAFLRGSHWVDAQQGYFKIRDRVKTLDVNPDVNVQRYGFVRAPEYMPERITNPEMHFINGESSRDFTVADEAILKQRLGARIRSERNVPASVDWSTFSFLDGRPDDVIKWVNIPVLQILDSYS